jgi:hypothetical protein
MVVPFNEIKNENQNSNLIIGNDIVQKILLSDIKGETIVSNSKEKLATF